MLVFTTGIYFCGCHCYIRATQSRIAPALLVRCIAPSFVCIAGFTFMAKGVFPPKDFSSLTSPVTKSGCFHLQNVSGKWCLFLMLTVTAATSLS